MNHTEKKFEKQLNKLLPKVLQELIDKGRLSVVEMNLIEDKKTNLTIRIKPDWNRPIKKGM